MVQNSIVAIPTANRPELLALTLERLDAARSNYTKDVPEVHIYCDSVPESRLREIEVVRDLYFPEAFLFHAAPHIAAPSGCWNILNAIRSAAKFAEKVYLVEEDVLVFSNFFHWHESIEKGCDSPGQSNKVAASCGRRHWDSRWKYRDLYTNPGACLRRPLLDALIPHINDQYFSGTREYLDRTFGPWHEITHLDDGLIRNVMKKEGMSCVYPDAPVCAHVGFRNYNVLHLYKNDEVDLVKRIARAREILATTVRSDYCRDFEAS